MSNKLGISLAFIAGVAAGSVVAAKLLENKYKQMANDEIESVKTMFCVKKQTDNEEKKSEEEKQKADETAYVTAVDALGYANKTEKEGEEDMVKRISAYVIAPEDFGESDFDTESLTYYADKVLLRDSTNEVVKNVDELVGVGSLETFGQYEDDSVFVRNTDLKKDFEILLDYRKYSDIVSAKPHLLTDSNDE